MVVNVPILFLVFNRIDTTKQVFEEIRKAKPRRLYVAADGPRNKEEKEKTEAVRKYILETVDWNCKVKNLFRKQNLGCGKAVSQAITWFFKNEEMGIILEDDCLPNQSFFVFCEDLLERYKDDERIMHISGSTFVNEDMIMGDYYFSKYPYIWGWATWKRAWKNYDFNLTSLNDFSLHDSLFNSFESEHVAIFWRDNFIKIKNNKIDTWDYQWVYALFVNHALSIVPKVNLVQNIGFSSIATHTQRSNQKLSLKTSEFLIKNHPHFIMVNKLADNYVEVNYFRVKKKLLSLINNLFYYIYGGGHMKLKNLFNCITGLNGGAVLLKKNNPGGIVHFGKNVLYYSGFKVFSGAENIFIGNNVHLVDALLNAGNSLDGKIMIGDNTFFGHNVMLLARSHNYNLFGLDRQNSILEDSIILGEGVWIGSGAIILGGVKLGDNCVVGAGSVVTKSFPKNSLICGNPAKLIRRI